LQEGKSGEFLCFLGKWGIPRNSQGIPWEIPPKAGRNQRTLTWPPGTRTSQTNPKRITKKEIILKRNASAKNPM